MIGCEHEEAHRLAAARAKENMPTEEKIERMGGIFKALSEPSRLKILLALTEGEMCVLHIVEAVGGNQSAVSHQLRILRDHRIIKARRDGQNIAYSLADEHVRELLSMALDHADCK